MMGGERERNKIKRSSGDCAVAAIVATVSTSIGLNDAASAFCMVCLI